MNHKSKHDLFHRLLKQLRKAKLTNKHFLLAVSGGLDSMTLLFLLLELKTLLKNKISVVHIHHGSAQKAQKKFQDQAAKMIKTFCTKHNIDFYSNKWVTKNYLIPLEEVKKPISDSEAHLRKYRYQLFALCMKQSLADNLLLAHNQDDLLETRLIRLIRGTGKQGLLSMSFKRGLLIRPFIQVSRATIKDYAKKRRLKWCEDPSNQSTDYSLRNWIRHEWLTLLEKKRPGSLKAMARSLELISEQAKEKQASIKMISQRLIKNQSLRIDLLQLFPLTTKKSIIAYYLKKQGVKNYSTSCIIDLLNKISTYKISNYKTTQSFSLVGQNWKLNKLWLNLE